MNVEFDKQDDNLTIKAEGCGLELGPDVLAKLFSKFVRMIYEERELQKTKVLG